MVSSQRRLPYADPYRNRQDATIDGTLQSFYVVALKFNLRPGLINSIYLAPRSNAKVTILPHIVFKDHHLLWEREPTYIMTDEDKGDERRRTPCTTCLTPRLPGSCTLSLRSRLTNSGKSALIPLMNLELQSRVSGALTSPKMTQLVAQHAESIQQKVVIERARNPIPPGHTVVADEPYFAFIMYPAHQREYVPNNQASLRPDLQPA
ncbi:Tol [Fusarium sp. NRRL 52700]|nr:Tol [Fusarium sp. NRRL 52700]